MGSAFGITLAPISFVCLSLVSGCVLGEFVVSHILWETQIAVMALGFDDKDFPGRRVVARGKGGDQLSVAAFVVERGTFLIWEVVQVGNEARAIVEVRGLLVRPIDESTCRCRCDHQSLSRALSSFSSYKSEP